MALGRKQPRLSLPVGPVRLVAGLIEKGASTIGIKSPVTRETVDKYTEDIAVDGSLIQQELGFVPQYNLKEGWEETTVKEIRNIVLNFGLRFSQDGYTITNKRSTLWQSEVNHGIRKST